MFLERQHTVEGQNDPEIIRWMNAFGKDKREAGFSWDDLIAHELRLLGDTPDLYGRLVEKLEKPLIEAVLDKCGGNQLRAAEMLGINRNTLHKKMRNLGLK